MDLSLIYNDPGHQQRASMMGMDMQAYVANMDPRAVQANIANLSRGPAVYNTQAQVDNMSRVGANSGANAFIPEQGSPITGGALSTPTQPTQPNVGSGVLNTASASRPVQTGATPAALSQPGPGDMLPEHGGGISEPFVPQYPGDVPDHVRNAQNSAPPTANPHPDAVLTSGGTAAVPGALTSGGNSPAATPAAAAPRPNAGPSSGARQTPTNNTGNARQSGMPDMKIGRMEQLGRMGSAMLGASGNGLNAAMSAGGNAMYAVNDENREAQMTEYENSERLRLEEAQRRATAASGGSGSGPGGASNEFGSVGAQAAQFNDIIAALKSDSNMTGPIAGTVGQARDRSGFGDANRANLRLQMEGIALNEQLLFTAQTKGAITDREMAMFRKPIPRITDDEAVWVAWLEPRAAVLNQLANNGISDAASAAGGQSTGSAPAPTNSATTDFSAADALVFGG